MVDGAGEVPREGVGDEGLDPAQPNSVAPRHLENSECQIGGSLRLLFGQRQLAEAAGVPDGDDVDPVHVVEPPRPA
jgi:hypothetical protein